LAEARRRIHWTNVSTDTKVLLSRQSFHPGKTGCVVPSERGGINKYLGRYHKSAGAPMMGTG
jgi:hypothetical protein